MERGNGRFELVSSASQDVVSSRLGYSNCMAVKKLKPLCYLVAIIITRNNYLL
jgi:hypothetical protein